MSTKNETALAGRELDTALELHHRSWTLDGDLYRCANCKRGQLASFSSEKVVHASDCKVKDVVSDHPWQDLARLITGIQTSQSNLA